MIELMVATATASLIVTAMLTFYARQRVMFKSAVETLGAFSNASDALSMVAEAARSAALPMQHPQRVRGGSDEAVFACEKAQVTGAWDQPACGPAAEQFGDGAQFAHSAGSPCRLSEANSSASTGTYVRADDGKRAVSHAIDASRWFVRKFPETGVPELYCLGRGDRASQPMVSGIDTLRIRRNIRSDSEWRPELRAGLRPEPAVAPPDRPMLEGLDLCVAARGRAGEQVVSYVDCDGQRIASADRIGRTVLGGWVAIRSGSTVWP